MIEKKFKVGTIQATIWKNETTPKDSEEKRTYNTITISKSFEEDGKWKPTNTLRLADLPTIELLCKKWYEYLLLRE